MFIAHLITKTEETAIGCKSFNDAWQILNKLVEESKDVLSGDVLEGEECSLAILATYNPIASVRIIK